MSLKSFCSRLTSLTPLFCTNWIRLSISFRFIFSSWLLGDGLAEAAVFGFFFIENAVFPTPIGCVWKGVGEPKVEKFWNKGRGGGRR
jgi:hypothetical protein